ncbi:MAG: bL28 family ribosomal protein [bacterium]|nr:bL28 family ribosomal protein [bacterium]
MAQRCDICERGAAKGNRRSHSNIATLTKRKINLQPRTIAGKRYRVCVNCLKSGRVPARVAKLQAGTL